MIRQAHTYLVGAVSGTALIGAAVITFVMLVSLQALKDWPLAGIGGGGDSAAVSTGQPASGAGNAANAGAGGAAAAGAAGNGANRAVRRHGGAGSLGGQGGNATGWASPAPSGGEAPSAGAGSTPSSAPGVGSGSGSSTGGGSGQSTSGAVTGAVNKTVSGVDQATGGTLGSTGVTTDTEETVNGAAGPESPVGKTVDKVVETVGGLLEGNK